jgi:hypothetical protein
VFALAPGSVTIQACAKGLRIDNIDSEVSQAG